MCAGEGIQCRAATLRDAQWVEERVQVEGEREREESK